MKKILSYLIKMFLHMNLFFLYIEMSHAKMVIIVIITRQNFNQVTIILIIVSLLPCNNDYYIAVDLKEFAAFGFKSVKCITFLYYWTRQKFWYYWMCYFFHTIYKPLKRLLIKQIIRLLTNINGDLQKICRIGYLSN